MFKITTIFFVFFCLLGTTTWAGNINYSTYVGASSVEYADLSIADDSLNFYVIGRTTSSGFATPNAPDTSYGGGGSADVFIAKYNKQGQLMWRTYYGGANHDQASGVAFDANGFLVLVGFTNSPDGIATAGSSQNNLAGLQDGFVAKFNTSGQLLYGTYYGFGTSDQLKGIAIAPDGDYYLLGQTNSQVVFSYPGIQQASSGGGFDAILVRMHSTGQIKWETYFGNTGNDYGLSILVDPNFNLYVYMMAGSSAGMTTPDAHQPDFSGGTYDALYCRFDTLGKRTYGSYFGGTGTDQAQAMCFDANWNLIISGYTNSSAGIATSGASQNAFAGGWDSYLAKMDTAFTMLWATYAGSNQADYITSITTDANNLIYTMGYTNSQSGISSSGAWKELYSGGSTDCFFQCYDATGQRVFSSYFGGDKNDYSTGISADKDGSIYFCGYSNSDTGIASVNAYQNTFAGNYDGLVFRYVIPTTSNPCAGTFENGFTFNKLIQCERDNQFVFTDTTNSNGYSISHYWDFGNGQTGSGQTETVHYVMAVENKFRVKLVTTLNGNCSDSTFKEVFLISSPATQNITGNSLVEQGHTENYSVNAKTGSTYQWFFESGTGYSLLPNINIKWTQIDTVMLKLVETNAGNCSSDTAYMEVVVRNTTGLKEMLEKDLQIFPNPSLGTFQISGLTGDWNFQIRDNLGRVWLPEKQFVNNTTVYVGNLPQGIYLLELYNDSHEKHIVRICIVNE